MVERGSTAAPASVDEGTSPHREIAGSILRRHHESPGRMAVRSLAPCEGEPCRSMRWPGGSPTPIAREHARIVGSRRLPATTDGPVGAPRDTRCREAVSSTTVASGYVPAPVGRGHPHGCLARWAVRLSAVFGAAFAGSLVVVAVAYAVGAEGAFEDTFLGWFLVRVMLAGFLGSLAAFLAAIAAMVRRERWALLWLPLSVFPVLLAFVVLGEAFWWE